MLLFVVNDSFEISGQSLVLTLGLPKAFHDLGPGSPILLKRPDGSVVESCIVGINIPRRRKPGGPYPISVLVEIRKKDVPAGTEVFAVEI